MIRKPFVLASWVMSGVVFGGLAIGILAQPSVVSAQTTGVAEVDNTQLQKRLQDRVTKLKTKVTAAEQARLKTRCVAAQGKVTALEARLKGVQVSRSTVYDGLIARLSLLHSRLNRQNVDSQLQLHIDKLKSLMATYDTDFAAYTQAVSDAAVMDCEADPTAFKAALEEARSSRTVVIKDVTAIKSYMTSTVKPYLQTLKTNVQGEGAN